jgi:hypothetical protein
LKPDFFLLLDDLLDLAILNLLERIGRDLAVGAPAARLRDERRAPSLP